MTSILAKIIAKKNAAAENSQAIAAAASHPLRHYGDVIAAQSAACDLNPCTVCGSAIRWVNASGVARCIGCHPAKFKSLERYREILTVAMVPGKLGDKAIMGPVRRWERLVELPDGRLSSATVLASDPSSDPATLTAAGGVGGIGDEGAGGRFATYLVEIDPDEYFHREKFFAKYLATDSPAACSAKLRKGGTAKARGGR